MRKDRSTFLLGYFLPIITHSNVHLEDKCQIQVQVSVRLC